MTAEQTSNNCEIEVLVANIRGLHQLFEQSISELRADLDRFEATTPSDELLRRADYWQVVIGYDSCVRLRQIIENNFHVIETLALLATVRYIFELGVWLRLVSSQSEYALAYYGELLKKECEHSSGMVRQLQRELELLDAFEERDGQATLGLLKKVSEGIDSEAAKDIEQLIRDSRLDVDREAARTFSLYLNRATQLGFGYTAHLVRTQAVPKAQERQQQAILVLEAFRKWCPAESQALVNRAWKWKREAQTVKLDGPYDFLYSYVSRLLHATPASVTTDVKNLEPDEIRILLRYIHGALLDVLDLIGNVRRRNVD